jgi:hypothetical protein
MEMLLLSPVTSIRAGKSSQSCFGSWRVVYSRVFYMLILYTTRHQFPIVRELGTKSVIYVPSSSGELFRAGERSEVRTTQPPTLEY